MAEVASASAEECDWFWSREKGEAFKMLKKKNLIFKFLFSLVVQKWVWTISVVITAVSFHLFSCRVSALTQLRLSQLFVYSLPSFSIFHSFLFKFTHSQFPMLQPLIGWVMFPMLQLLIGWVIFPMLQSLIGWVLTARRWTSAWSRASFCNDGIWLLITY